MTVKSGSEGIKAVAAIAKKKGTTSVPKLCLLAFIAGGYIAVGTLLAVTVGGNLPTIAVDDPGLQSYIFASFGVPFALTFILVAGGNLLTGDLMIMPVGVLSGTVHWTQLLKVWACSFWGNFCGAFFFIWFLAYVADLPTSTSSLISIAEKKVTTDAGILIVRGIGCNWMVCMGVWLAILTDSLTEKLLSCWITVGTFIAIGWSHSVVNMALLPLAWLYDAGFSFGDYFLDNLLPVTFGNVLGGQLIGLTYWYLYGDQSTTTSPELVDNLDDNPKETKVNNYTPTSTTRHLPVQTEMVQFT